MQGINITRPILGAHVINFVLYGESCILGVQFYDSPRMKHAS
jgi:hypothetical protein